MTEQQPARTARWIGVKIRTVERLTLGTRLSTADIAYLPADQIVSGPAQHLVRSSATPSVLYGGCRIVIVRAGVLP